MSALAYPPLNRAESEIRVLALGPGFLGEPIVCKLDTVSLGSFIEYEALSYTWGETTLCREIVVNGSPVSISENAFVALMHLRNENSVRRVWIDAICINQLNDSERAHQVKMMKDIYQRSTRVLVWLGPARRESDSGLDLLVDLCRKTSLASQNRTGVPTQNFQELPVAPLRALMDLLRRPYWRRVWIIQETAVATLEPLIGCGQRWLSWNTWKNGLIHIYAYDTSGESRNFTEDIDLDHEMILPDLGLCNRFFDLDWIRAVTGHKRGDKKLEPRNLQEILHFSRGRESLDPRDRIYAVLGLIRSSENLCPLELIDVDYSKSLRHIYSEVANFALRTEKNLDILFFRNHLRHAHFPSWLPDFSSTSNKYPSLKPKQLNIWSASRHTMSEPPWAPDRSPKLSDDFSALLVSGRLVDTIDRVLDLRGIRTDPLAIFHQIRLFALPNTQKTNETTNLFYVEEALWRTLLGNLDLHGRVPSPSAFRHAFTKLLYQELSQLPDHSADASQVNKFLLATTFTISHSNVMPHRRLFITRTGRFGLGPPDCESEDIVSLLWSYSMPTILRSSATSHEFVGNAYVHGMMNGEDVPSSIDDLDWINLEIQ